MHQTFDTQYADNQTLFMLSNTAENLKSHLQKFRIHRDRSRGEYASYYELSTRQVEEKSSNLSNFSTLMELWKMHDKEVKQSVNGSD